MNPVSYSRRLLLTTALVFLAAPDAGADKSDFDTWTVNVHFVVGVDSYSGQAKTAVDAWIGGLVTRAEGLYTARPKLNIRETIVRQTSAGGRTLARMNFETGAEYGKFMEHHFDNMARTKTDGWLTVLIVNDICIGYYKDAAGNKTRHCIGGRATFPHWVTPFSRKHGIILVYPDSRNHLLAHELGHFFSLKHTFEPYVNVIPSLNCNTDYRPLWEDGHCASCKSGADLANDTCTGSANVMDYCDSDNRVYLNACQVDRAAGQRKKYMTSDGETDYFQMKGLRGEAICKQDGDCEGEEYCDTGIAATLGRNRCVPVKADEQGCTRATQCASGACNVRCYAPGSKSMGQACNINDECKVGTCSGAGWGVVPGKCVCTEDSHCAAGQYCNTGVADIGTNVCKSKLADGAVCTKAHQCAGGACNVRCYTPASKNMGASCNIDAECSEGKCSGTGWGVVPGKCVCENDADCGSGKYCNTGVAGIGTNTCKDKLDLGQACTKAHQCSSGCCKLYNFKLQCRPADKCN